MKPAIAIALVLGLAGCGSSDHQVPAEVTAFGVTAARDSLSDRLHLFSWPDYMDPEILAGFEETYGVRVVTDYYDNNESLVAKLKAGGIGQYDVIIASDYAVELLRTGELLEPLDHARIPNLANLDARFRDLPFDPGNRFTATYQWGTSGLGYRADLLGGDTIGLDSWATVFGGDATRGPLVMLADQRETIGAALMHLGFSPNSTDSTELAAAGLLLLRQRPNVQTYAPFATGRDLLASGDAAVAHNYSGDVLTAAAEVPGIRYVIPREGAIMWTDNMAVPVRAPSAYTAHLFINYMLDADVGARLSNFTRYASPNAAALPSIDPALRADRSIYPDSAVLARLHVLRDVGAARGLYDRIWTRLRAAR